MTVIEAKIIAVSAGGNDDLSKNDVGQIEVDFFGIVGDHHAGVSREAYGGDREPKGTILRNDRQWSGVSIEELTEMSDMLDLAEPITASTLGANLCFEGVNDFSMLPRGSRLKFPSGAVLTVEEYNPPCSDMGAQIAAKYTSDSSTPLTATSWLRPAAGRRGLVGVIDVPGEIKTGDEVEIRLFEEPEIRLL